MAKRDVERCAGELQATLGLHVAAHRAQQLGVERKALQRLEANRRLPRDRFRLAVQRGEQAVIGFELFARSGLDLVERMAKSCQGLFVAAEGGQRFARAIRVRESVSATLASAIPR